MKLSSCLYGFVAHGAVFLLTGGCMLLAMAASLPIVFLFDRLPDVVFTAGAILFLLGSYAYVWFLAVRFAYNQKMRLFDVQLGSFVLLAFMVSLYLLDGSSMTDIVRNWDDAGCAFVPPAFSFLCFTYALVLLPVYQSKLWHLILPNGVRLKDLFHVLGDLVLILMLLIGATLLFLSF
ncbi:hypothetical protein MOD48_04385 [Bacillus spizizenii]|uniref:Integral inner membrane protein n=1 Tax=Bacillus spizizenii TaxID=96241 RepID=A0A9Q4DM59_BACSC|nr:hypothetical protein [Bacillus spizizenii]KFI02518.1 hypothetical protein JN25_13390 [Bacillus sp. BSC154]MDU7574969.1 hypothetical protein [Bacillus subtilis]MCY7806300.1 hypothetical protein [Bacillus spizizenii]MCY7810284.1 hypothetical protein [Bacillus spizizenii]MCY7825495.1 hypothetical protein [Bacillus spizizenii]